MADASNSIVPANAVAIPGHNSTSAASAGVAAVPMDDEEMQQPVIAYFQFIQQNVQHIQAGDVDRVMREAEQRHLQIMQATVDSIRERFQQEYNQQQVANGQQLANAQSQYDLLRRQMTDVEMQNQALQAQVATLQNQNNALNANVQSGSTSVAGLQSQIQQMQVEHGQALERLKASMTEGFRLELHNEVQRTVAIEVQKAVDESISEAEAVIESLKGDHNAELQKVNSTLGEEIKRLNGELDLSAESNDLLQEELDMANSRIQRLEDALKLPQSSERPATTNVPEQAEKATGSVPAPSVAKAPEPEQSPKQQVAPKETIAEQAARRLKAKANEGKSAAVTGVPTLPLTTANLPKVPSTVSIAATTPIRTPSKTNVFPSPAPSVIADAPEKPGKEASGDAAITGQHLLEIVKSLTKRDDPDGKPKIKEAETIKLHDMPTPETYRSWKNHVRDEVKACSDKPDEAWEWLNEVFDKKLDRKALEAKLQDPGKFITLDTKLSSALTRSAKGDLGTRILNYKDEMSKNNVQVRGRTVLLMFDDYYKTSIEAGSLYRVEDLLGVAKIGDTIGDLRKFVNRWDATIAGMENPPDDFVLRDILLRQVRGSSLMKYDIEVFDRAREGTHEKSYKFLHQSMKEMIDRERLRENRNRIVQRQTGKEGKQPNAGVAAKPGPRKGSPKRERGRSEEPKKKGICYKFQEGKCNLGKACQYRHESPKRSRSEKGKGKGRERSRSPSKGKQKKLSREEMAKTPCTFFARGSCKRGDKCYYKHDTTAAPAKEKNKPRPNSPAAKKDSKKSAVCIQHACIAKSLPGLRSSPSQERKAPQKHVRFNLKPQIIKVTAVGEQCKLADKSRRYTKVYPDASTVPAPSEKEQHLARVHARQLREAIRVFEREKPVCKFLCDEPSLTCKHCRRVSGPVMLCKVPIDHGVTPSAATPVQTGNKVSWLVDSGSEQDLISKSMLHQVNASECKPAPNPVTLTTANGFTEATEVADVRIKSLLEKCLPYVLEQTPAVLSVGTRCMIQGYSFVWPAGGLPILIRPDGKVIELKIEGYVPVLDDSCKAVSQKKYRKSKQLCRLFAMPGVNPSLSVAAAHDSDGGIDELVDDDEGTEYVRSRKEEDLIAEAKTAQHQFTHFPKNPFCRTCQRARMMAPQARKKGGQARVETKKFGDHIIADHVLVRTNVEEGWKGESVALVVKDLHTQFRCVYPSRWKDAHACVDALNHFISQHDGVETVYTDNSRELIKAIEDLGYRHQTSIEYVDSSKSFVEREVRQMLEGARSNLVQSGFPLQFWPLAMQHHAVAINASKQLDGKESPWQLRFGDEFPGKIMPFGAKVLFWNNPKRADNTSGKLSPTSNEGVFLGYHIQPGHSWKGEYLVAKLEALDYHVENKSLTVQRSKKVELPSEGFVFPLRALHEANEPKPDKLEDNVVPPNIIPPESELKPIAMEDDVVPECPPELPSLQEDVDDYSPGTPVPVKSKPAAERLPSPGSPPKDPASSSKDKGGTPKPDIPEGYHYDGTRLVKTYKNSKRPKHIPSEYWTMLGPKKRKELIEEENAKLKAAAEGGDKASSSSSAKPAEKKASVAKPRLPERPFTKATAKHGHWEVIPEDRPRFSVPAMPKAPESYTEEHRSTLRELVKQKIGELEFQNALTLFAAVARLVSKQEVAANPKAKAAMDKEWNNLREKGVWDEKRARECRDIVSEAKRQNQTVHLGRIFEACYEKGSELSQDDPRRKFKGRTVFQGNNVRDENSDHALFNELGSSPASMEAAKLLDAYGSQPGYAKQQADAVQAYIQALFTGVPTWLSLPKDRWPASWNKEYWQPMVPMVLALYGHPDSGGIWEKHLNGEIAKKGWRQILPDTWNSIFYHDEYKCMLVVYVDDFKLAGPKDKLASAWKSLRSAVNIGEPEPFDRYFGCMHREFNQVKLPPTAHPFAFVFDETAAAAAAQHRTQDWWEHDVLRRAWVRHHIQPRKRLFDPGDEGGFSAKFKADRITIFDSQVTMKACVGITASTAQGGSMFVQDQWTQSRHSQPITHEFWTGRTIFTYGEDQEPASFAVPSKNRPGPHRDKREAKKEAKAQRFKKIENAVSKKAGVMTKPVNLVRYDMASFLESCVEAYCQLAKVDPSTLGKVSTPFTEAGIARPTLDEHEKPGRLQPIASKVLMKILFAARMARFDLLRATQSLASRVTKWSVECDIALHRLVAYINCSKDQFLEGFIGDDFKDCQLWLFADADHAGEHDSKSTTGSAIILVGPNTYYPLNAFSKKQSVISISSTEAEVVAANHALRAEGIPMLALFQELNLFQQGKKPAAVAGKPSTDSSEEVVTRIDPEIDEIRNGNVDSGIRAGDINGLKASFPEFYQMKFMEDNQATITVCQSGSSASMRHTNKTQNISFKWIKQQFEKEQFDLLNVGTLHQVADILTKPFPEPKKWEHALRLIGIGATKVPGCRSEARPSVATVGHQGGIQRLLIEFCCAHDSKLSEKRDATKGCKCIRVTEAEDGTTESCRNWLAQEVKDFRASHPKGKILLYASLPCVGGSPWGNINGKTEEGEERIKEQQKDFTRLFKSFRKTVEMLKDENVHVAFELSRNCKYWHWPMIRNFISVNSLETYDFDGCMFGVVGKNNNPMKKGWKIATDLEQLACLAEHRCDGMHVHDESRGTALKLAEGYTHKLTDLIHECFRQLAVSAQAPRVSRKLACPAMSSSSAAITHPIQSASAKQKLALLTEVPESEQDKNLTWWNKIFLKMVSCYYNMTIGPADEQRKETERMLSVYTPQSTFEICCGGEDAADLFANMLPLTRITRGSVKYLPLGKDQRAPTWILVSDSAPCMVSGKGKNMKKFPMDEVFSQRRPGYVSRFIHEMLWGQDLRRIVKRTVEIIKQVREEIPESPIIALVYWNGNELVGEQGVIGLQHWPWSDPKGDYPTIMADLKRHISWFHSKCKEYNVEIAGVMAEPNGYVYNLRGPFEAMINEIKAWFLSEFEEERFTTFRYLSQKDFAFDLELRDQYHPAHNEVNLERIHGYFHNLFLILDGQRRMREGIQAAILLPKRPAGLLDAVKDPEAGLTPTPDAKPRKEELWLQYAPRAFNEEWKQTTAPMKTKVDIPGTEFTTEEMCLRIPDTKIAEELGEEILRRDEEKERAKADAAQEEVAKKARQEYEQAEAKAKAEEAAAKEQQRKAEEERQARETKLRETAKAVAAARANPKPAAAPEPGSLPSPQQASSSEAAPQQSPSVAPVPIKPYFMEEHVPSYSYVYQANKFGEIVEHVEVDGTVHELVTCSGKDLGCQYLFYHKNLNDWLTRVNKVCRGHGKNSLLPFDHEMFLDLERFAQAFRKEVPTHIRISIYDIAAIAFKDAKGRFELKCVEGLPAGGPKNLRFWPFKIRAVQGHSGKALADRSIFHSATKMYYLPGAISTDRKVLVGPSTADSNPPQLLFHRTTPSAWKSILKDGLLPGSSLEKGGSDKVHVYCSDKSLNDSGYQAGVRAKYHIEFTISCKSALEDGAVFFRTRSDAILTPFPIEAQHIISVVDTQKNQVLWTRKEAEGTASLTGEPKEGVASSSAASVTGEPATESASVKQSKSKQPPTPPPSKRMLETGEKPPEPGHPPPATKARRVMMTDAPKGMKFNILTDECALCGTIVVSGQKQCDLCGNDQEMLLADHVPELIKDPEYKGGGAEEWKRNLKARRKEALMKMGVRSEARNEMLDILQKEDISEIRQNVVGDSGRGVQSVESLLVTQARKMFKRASNCGHTSCVDRFNHDLAFHEAKVSEGVTCDDLAKMDLLAHCHLASPARSSTQVALGVASGRQYDNTLVKLAYINADTGIFEPPYNEKRFDKPWLFIWEHVVFDEREYVTYIEGNPRFRFITTWDGIVELDPPNAFNQLREIYARSLPKVQENIDHKHRQSQVNLEQNKRKADTMQEQPAESSGTASAVARRSSGQQRWNAYSRSDSSYTHHGETREEWSWWRGQWWSRRGRGTWYPHYD